MQKNVRTMTADSLSTEGCQVQRTGGNRLPLREYHRIKCLVGNGDEDDGTRRTRGPAGTSFSR